MALHRLLQFGKHFLRKRSKRSVHSPFVFEMLEKVWPDSFHRNLGMAQTYRSTLLGDETPIQLSTFGATHRPKPVKKPINEVVLQSSISPQQARFLMRLVDYLKPDRILEFGTHLGVSTAFLRAGHRAGEFITVEAHKPYADRASFQLNTAFKNVPKVINTTFDAWLEQANGQAFDFIFLDGHHTEEATLRYADALLKRLHPGGALVLHDIHWSAGMTRAWSTLWARQDLTLCIDTYDLGLIWPVREQARERFYLPRP